EILGGLVDSAQDRGEGIGQIGSDLVGVRGRDGEDALVRRVFGSRSLRDAVGFPGFQAVLGYAERNDIHRNVMRLQVDEVLGGRVLAAVGAAGLKSVGEKNDG